MTEAWNLNIEKLVKPDFLQRNTGGALKERRGNGGFKAVIR